MRTIIIISLVTTLALLAGASTAHTQQSWVGDYVVTGVNHNGSTYKGTATIRTIVNNTYHVAWQTGTQEYAGFGFVDAQGYLVVGGLDFPLIVSYAPGGSGTWLEPGAPTVATEKLTKQ